MNLLKKLVKNWKKSMKKNSNKKNPNQDLGLDQNQDQENRDQFDNLEIKTKIKLLHHITIILTIY